jgi:hypothetical protein
MGQFIEHIVDSTRIINMYLISLPALPMDSRRISISRGVIPWITRALRCRHSPYEHLPTHTYSSLYTGNDPLGHAWILPDGRAEPGGHVVFGLDPQGSEASPHHQRHDDDHDGCDDHGSLSFL